MAKCKLHRHSPFFAGLALLVLLAVRPMAAAEDPPPPHARPSTLCQKGMKALAGAGLLVVGLIAKGIYDDLSYEGPESFAFEKNICCACQWQAHAECAELGSMIACNTTKFPPNDVGECRWRGGKCKSRNETGCEDWKSSASQKGCASYASAEREEGLEALLASAAGKSCGTFRFASIGHGLGCEAFGNRTAAIAKKAPANIKHFQVEDDGCSTFSDLPASEELMRRLQPVLGEARTATLSANQCWAGGACQPRYVFAVSSDGVRGTPGHCQKEWDTCFNHNVSLQCKKKGELITQRCCCEKPSDFTTCSWHLNAASCP